VFSYIGGIPNKMSDTDKIQLGDMEFDTDELQELVSAGQKLREFEEGQGQSLEDMNKSWGRRGQQIGELKQQIQEYESKLTSYTNPTTPESQEIEQAKQTLGNLMNELGYVKKDEILTEVNAINEGRALLGEMQSLESQKNPYGAEELPKFETQQILEHMQETGIRNPERAYKDLYMDEIAEWKAEEKMKSRPSGLHTESGNAGNKQPSEVKVTAQNLEDMVRESLSGR